MGPNHFLHTTVYPLPQQTGMQTHHKFRPGQEFCWHRYMSETERERERESKYYILFKTQYEKFLRIIT